MYHFGFCVLILLVSQLWCAWRIGCYTCEFLEGEKYFYSVIAAAVMFAADTWVWFRRKGYLCPVFYIPGIVLFVMAVLPILALHVRDILLKTH